ncbi:MAG: hypothetical protein ACK5Y2_11815 [Bdellovibrionales bacterium]
MKFCSLISSFLAFACALPAVASTTGISTAIHQHYQAPRALGMGNAFVAVANDYSALFYNPAGLARLDENDLNMSFDLAGTPSLAKFVEDIEEAQDTPGSESDKQSAIAGVLQRNFGNRYAVRVGAPQAIWARPGWAVGIIPMDLTMRFSVHNSIGPAVAATVHADTTVAYGYGAHVKGFEYGLLSWGITGKAIHRGYFSQNVNFIELAADPNIVSDDDLATGYTADADLGLLWTPHIPDSGLFSLLEYTRPTFGLVVRNVGELGFQRSNLLDNENEQKPEKLYRVIDVGSRWEYPSFWIFSGRGVLDVRDILHPGFNWRKGLHAGFEFDWTMTSWWKGHYRVGISQGFWTAGLSAKFTVFNLDLVSYGEDVGTFGTPVESRIWMLRASMNF